MKPNLLFIGKMASGKTHGSRFVQDKYGYTILSLASPIKIIEHEFNKHDNGHGVEFQDKLWQILGSGKVINNKQFWNFIRLMREEVGKIPLDFPKPRKRLQIIGTDIGRKQIDDEIWIKIALNTIAENPDKHFVCDDVRFVNEYAAFIEADFTALKLVVSPEMQCERLEVLYGMNFDEVKEALTHDSEQEIDLIPAPPECYIDADQNLIKMYKEIEVKLGF